MAKHVCPNLYKGEGARGGCFFEIEAGEKPEHARLRVGWSCVIVHDDYKDGKPFEIPVTWLSELIAIATAHPGGIAKFLADHNYGGGYGLMCDPEPITQEKFDDLNKRAE
jgi:hypothetical protein